MPAPIVLVYNNQDFLDAACAALEASGFATACFSNSLEALDALEAAQTVNYLVTGIAFDVGQPNGVSLARLARAKRPDTRALFIGTPEDQPFTEDLGTFVLSPVDAERLVETVRLWLTAQAS